MDVRKNILGRLADLSQDIAGPIPMELIRAWTLSDKSEETHAKILQSHRKIGTVVSSDSSGLSRLSTQKSLLEVMKLVSVPKEIIHAFGKQIGGRGVGVWSADNSQMFYDDGVDPERVLNQMAVAQKEIAAVSEVQVGLAVHHGEFLEIGGGFFGDEAEFVELLAEEHSGPGEILVTESVEKKISKTFCGRLSKREELSSEKSVFAFDYSTLDFYAHRSLDTAYPLPFARDFFEYLHFAGMTLSFEDVPVKKYFHNKHVVFVKIFHERKELLLAELTEWVIVNTMMNEIGLRAKIEVIKSNGDLGIFVSEKFSDAFEFVEGLQAALLEGKFAFNIGMAYGELLIFPLENGFADIAGNAVNIASKISEDVQERNHVHIHDSVLADAKKLHAYEAFQLVKSGVELSGWKKPVKSQE